MVRTPFKGNKKHTDDSLGAPREFSQESPGKEHYRVQIRTEGTQTRLAGLETTFGVEEAGTAAMASAPPRPGKQQLQIARVGPDQLCEQVTNFRNGQRKPWSCGLRGIEIGLRSRAGLVLSTDACQEGMSKHHEGDMYVIRNTPLPFSMIEHP